SDYSDLDITFDDTAVAFAPNLIVNVTPNSVTFNNNTVSYVLSGTGMITGTTGLTKTNGGTVTIANVNTYTGNTLLNQGTLMIGASSTVVSGTLVSGPLGTGTVTLGAGTTFGG